MECFCSAVFYFSWLQKLGEFNMSKEIGVLIGSGYYRFAQIYGWYQLIFQYIYPFTVLLVYKHTGFQS